MAKDRLFFLISFAVLSLVAAYSFSNKNPKEILPPAEATTETKVEVIEKEPDKQNHFLDISPGKIAMPLLLNSRSAIVNFMNPGDLIDILFTSKSDIGLGSITLPLLYNIRILAIGKDPVLKNSTEKSSLYKSNAAIEILIEMTPKQAEILSYAENTGNININISQQDMKEGKQLKPSHEGLLEKLLEADSEVNFSSVLVTQMMNSLFPKAKIKILATARGYIVSGTVPDSQTGENIIQTLNLLANNGEKSVVNLIEKVESESSSVEVLIAQADLKEHQPLKNGDYSWMKVDKSDSNPSYILKNPQSEELVKQAILAKNIRHGDRIYSNDLLWGHEVEKLKDLKMSSLELAPGKRAIPFQLSTRSPITQFIKPGLLVDIKFISRRDIGFDPVSVILLKNVRVLSIENDLTESSFPKPFNGEERFFKPETRFEIFLEMTAEESYIFSFAETSGSIILELPRLAPEDGCDFLVQSLNECESLGEFQSRLVTHMIRSHFPLVDIKVISTSKGYIVEGAVPDPQMAEKIIEILIKLVPGGETAIINMMDVEPQQVLLCVKVVEVAKDFNLRVGINWQVLYQTACKSLAFGAIYPSPPLSDPNYFYKAFAQSGDYSITALIDMLEEDGLAKILAEPNLTTISGVKANFFAGGEFPILIPQGGGLVLGGVTVEYKKYGILLDFTPFVDLNGLITLHVIPEVSNLDKENSVIISGFVIPSLISRRVDTIVKLWPGQSYLIAGLYLDELTNKDTNLYGLNRIPFIGALFGSKNIRSRRTELLIVVTPYLINNTNGYPRPPIDPSGNCSPCSMIPIQDKIMAVQSAFDETSWETSY